MDGGEFEEIPEMPVTNVTDEEIRNYMSWLGADLHADRDLFWIAREALRAPLPEGWKLDQRKDGSGDPF